MPLHLQLLTLSLHLGLASLQPLTDSSLPFQVYALEDDILKNVEYDALRIVFNKFRSVISFQPTMATVLSAEVTSYLCNFVKNSYLFFSLDSYLPVFR